MSVRYRVSAGLPFKEVTTIPFFWGAVVHTGPRQYSTNTGPNATYSSCHRKSESQKSRKVENNKMDGNGNDNGNGNGNGDGSRNGNRVTEMGTGTGTRKEWERERGRESEWEREWGWEREWERKRKREWERKINVFPEPWGFPISRDFPGGFPEDSER